MSFRLAHLARRSVPQWRQLVRPRRPASSESRTALGKASTETRGEWNSDRLAREVQCTLAHKFVLVCSFTCWPHKVPSSVSQGTLNQAFSRFRILTATLTMFGMLYLTELAIRRGRKARDGGDDCLYDTATAKALQQRKRDFQNEMAAMERERARLEAEIKKSQPRSSS